MQTVGDYVQDFYSKHNSFLQNHYPGITSDILQQYFEDFSKSHSSDLIKNHFLHFFEDVLVGRPLEYIKKEKFFFRSPFYVDERVLIPRNETEILVEDSLNFLNGLKTNELNIAEVGVGSFALGLSILIDLNKKTSMIGTDISKEALEVAKINSFRLKSKINPQTLINLIHTDRLKGVEGEFDFIVSNPPYIKRSATDLVHDSVLKTEPDVALFIEDQHYESWFKKLFESASNLLTKTGAFFMEGHEDTLEDLKKIADDYFTSTKLKNDYTGRVRFLHCFK